MTFNKITSEKLSDAVVRQIEGLILRGILRPGERLPAERELAEQLGVSRPSLRTAIADLSDQGLLQSKVGSGVFVADVFGSAFSKPLIRLFSRHNDALFDTVDFRMDIEGLAAERAARLGTESDLKVIDLAFSKMAAAQDRQDNTTDALLDVRFHMAIIEASNNVIILHMMRSMYQLLEDGVFYNRQVMFDQKTTRNALLDQHRAINSAIQDRQPETARAAVQAHLGFVKSALADEQKRARNEAIARLRFGRESSK